MITSHADDLEGTLRFDDPDDNWWLGVELG
jgi:hypothetical protein